LNTKLAKPSRPIHALLARRWSPRAFDEARPIAQEALTQLFEAARWAPSCFNEQPWRYLVCNRATEPDAWADVLACLVEGNRKWARRAPTLIAAIAASHFSDSGKPNRWAPYDTGAASENMFLQATALGLAMHQMGGFDAAQVHARFGVPAEFEVPIFVTADMSMVQFLITHLVLMHPHRADKQMHNQYHLMQLTRSR
jgi:nitroreductase